MEHRSQKRIFLENPIEAKTRIYLYKDKKASDNYTFVTIKNISTTGLQFSSPLNFPVSDELVLFIDLPLFPSKASILGTIVWKKKEQKNNIYGVSIKSTNMGYIQSISEFVKIQPSSVQFPD